MDFNFIEFIFVNNTSRDIYTIYMQILQPWKLIYSSTVQQSNISLQTAAYIYMIYLYHFKAWNVHELYETLPN